MSFVKSHRKGAAAIAAASALVALGVTAVGAHAAPKPSATVRAQQVIKDLGAASGGSYLDKNQHTVVNVVKKSDMAKVRAAGLTPKLVTHSMKSLTSAKDGLDGLGLIKYSSWGIDTSTNQVVVTVSKATPKAAANKLM